MVFIKISVFVYLNIHKMQPLYLANTTTKIQLWISINVTTFLYFFYLRNLAIEIHTHKATTSIIFHKNSAMIIHPLWPLK